MNPIVDITGEVFGELKVIGLAERPKNIKNTSAYWLCKCSCGKEVIVKSKIIRSGVKTSCGCATFDLTGQKFGRWTVIKFSHKGKGGFFWECKCDCGNEGTVLSAFLRQGRTKSCGCLRLEIQKLPEGDVITKRIRTSYKYYAIKRGFSFQLSLKEVQEVIFKNCFYCNSPPDKLGKRGRKNEVEHILYHGMDRKDNTLGYFKENVVPCCTKCNRMKMDMSEMDFYNQIKKVQQVLIKKKIWQIL